MYAWMIENWSRAALITATVMLVSLPFFAAEDLHLILLYATLPLYMVHQFEEHSRGAFVRNFNATIGRGRTVLTPVSAFWINILGVWVLFIVSFYAAKHLSIGFALTPVYLVLVNGLKHVASAVRLRAYNPGLYTAAALFLPLGALLLVYFTRLTERPLLFNVVGLLIALLVHGAIVAYVAYRLR